MRTAGCQKHGMLGLVTRVSAASGDIDILKLGCYDESVAFASRVSAVDGEPCLESMDGKEDAEEVYAFGQVVHLHGLDGFGEVLTPQVAVVSWFPTQNSVHDMDKFMRPDRNDILGFFMCGSVHEIGDETVGRLLTLIKRLSSSLECRDCIAHILVRFVFLDKWIRLAWGKRREHLADSGLVTSNTVLKNMAWPLTEQTLLVRIRVAAVVFYMAFVSASFAVVGLALWHNHDLDLRTGIMTGRGGMGNCVAPLAPQGLELRRRNLPGSSHDITARTRLFLWTIRRPMVFATAEVTLPVPIIAIFVAIVLIAVLRVLVLRTVWVFEAFGCDMTFFVTIGTSLILFVLRRHCGRDMTNEREMNMCLPRLYV